MTTKHVRSAAAGLAMLASAAASHGAPADDTIATSNGPLEIHAIHHASFMMTWNGKHILVDPAPVEETGDPTPPYRALPKPDVILITHIHFDHFNVPILQAVAGPQTEIVAPRNVYEAMPADLKAKTHVMKNGDRTTADGIPVEAVPMHNVTPDRMKFHPVGLGNGYIATLGGKRIYIAGDTEEFPQIEHLVDIDAAFIPMNLPYTETVEAAAKWVKDFRPKIVYPYHYHNQDGTLSDIEKFKTLVGNASEVRFLKWY
jgi:L-ascorbate metabolism protein UlaG (beta-lactamase superfamily)